MVKPKYYAVRVGRIPGIYNSWEDCVSQVIFCMARAVLEKSTNCQAISLNTLHKVLLLRLMRILTFVNSRRAFRTSTLLTAGCLGRRFTNTAMRNSNALVAGRKPRNTSLEMSSH